MASKIDDYKDGKFPKQKKIRYLLIIDEKIFIIQQIFNGFQIFYYNNNYAFKP